MCEGGGVILVSTECNCSLFRCEGKRDIGDNEPVPTASINYFVLSSSFPSSLSSFHVLLSALHARYQALG